MKRGDGFGETEGVPCFLCLTSGRPVKEKNCWGPSLPSTPYSPMHSEFPLLAAIGVSLSVGMEPQTLCRSAWSCRQPEPRPPTRQYSPNLPLSARRLGEDGSLPDDNIELFSQATKYNFVEGKDTFFVFRITNVDTRADVLAVNRHDTLSPMLSS